MGVRVRVRYTPLVLLLLAACTAPPDTPGKDPDDPAVACDALDVAEVAYFDPVDLPQRYDSAHTNQGVGIGDLDGDGWLDALIGWGGGSFALRNDGTGTLVFDNAVTTDGGPLSPAESMTVGDLDGDGDLDALLGRWDAESELLWNDGTGHFAVEPIVGTEVATFATAFGDADGDGDPDVFLSAARTDMTYEEIVAGNQIGDPNLLLLQDADHHFSVATDALPADTLNGMTLTSAWLDADADGDLDVYVANDAGPFVDPNHLLLNDGTGHFSDATDCACGLAMFAMGAAVGDANQDGLPDLYVTDVGGPNLLLNMGDGTFVDATLATGAAIAATEESMVSWGTAFVDLDADTDQDLVVTFGQSGKNFAAADLGGVDGPEQPSQILLSDGAGSYARAPAPGFDDPSRTRTMALGDFDRDGRPDLITVGKYFVRQWHTTGGCTLGATLRFHGKNAVGARVETTVNGHTNTSWNLPSTTSASSAEEVYLGFGGAASAEHVVVTWPGGAVTELEDVGAGAVEELDEP
jgi:hypothetical protein